MLFCIFEYRYLPVYIIWLYHHLQYLVSFCLVLQIISYQYTPSYMTLLDIIFVICDALFELNQHIQYLKRTYVWFI